LATTRGDAARHLRPDHRQCHLPVQQFSLTQQETWAIFEADDAAAIMKRCEPWTDFNIHQIAPVMDFAELKKFVSKG
jgi:Domain of unknown function (DUF3303)